MREREALHGMRINDREKHSEPSSSALTQKSILASFELTHLDRMILNEINPVTAYNSEVLQY